MSKHPRPQPGRWSAICRGPLAVTVLALAAPSCEAPLSTSDDPGVAFRNFNGYVPPPPDCNMGVGANRCMVVPPIHVENPPRWELDGVRSDTEYLHAVALPYSNPHAKATGGNVYVSVDDEFAALHIFVERAPLLDARELRVLIDHDRFDQSTNWVDQRDRSYSIDVDSGEMHDARGAGTQWNVVDEGGFQAVLGGCEGSDVGDLRYCDVEFEIAIEEADIRDALLASVQGGPPAGIGLAVTDEWQSGASPEEISTVDPGWMPDASRNLFQTLLFGRPPGIPVSFVSFNVHRFTPFMQQIESSGFDRVPLTDIARLLAPYDVVAVQELWGVGEAERLFELIKQERQSLGLTGEYHWMPGGDFDPEFLLLEDFQSLADDTNGGVHVYSRFAPTSSDYEVYSDCRGEDCLKAKGAQHVRLWLDPPDPNEPEGCGETIGRDGPAEPQGCPMPSSHSRVLDVFNTHMQASDPKICENVTLFLVMEAALSPFAILWYDDLINAEFKCLLVSDEEVRRRQLDQLDAFIVATTQGSRRPSVILGDFNIDGRDLDESEYRDVLRRLHVGPQSDPGGAEPSDIVNPWRFDFDWDIDHGDVARETLDPWPDPATNASYELAGTFIGEDMGRPNERLDFILVRPPVQPDVPGAGDLDFVIAKTEGLPTWQKIWPGGPGAAPERSSDHELVVAALELVQFVQPPAYHGDWNHDYTFRVSSVDATGHKDCVLGICGQLELYPRIHGRMITTGGEVNIAGPWNAGNCGGNQSSYPADGCTSGWGFSGTQIAGTDVELAGAARLKEDDDSSADDTYETMYPGGHPQLFFEWANGIVAMRDWTGSVTPSTWPGDHPLADNAPFEWCTDSSPDKMCLRLEITELPPGQQY